jgi:alpha-beta hydrolase superfamily lysophospholipase
LIAIGGEDPLGGEKSVHTLAEKYISRSKLTDVEVVIYADARHEIYNELNKDEAMSDLISWLNSRVHF